MFPFRRALVLLTIWLAWLVRPPPRRRPRPPGSHRPTPNPQPPAWHGSLSLGLSSASGVQAQRSLQVQSSLVRPFSTAGALSPPPRTITSVYVSMIPRSPIAPASRSARTSTRREHRDHPDHDVICATACWRSVTGSSRWPATYRCSTTRQAGDRVSGWCPDLSIYKEISYADAAGWKPAYGSIEIFRDLRQVWSIQNSFRFRRDFTDAKH